MMESGHDQLQQGLQLCLDAGMLGECDVHEGEYFLGSTEPDDGYRIIMGRFKSGELQLEPGENNRDITDRMKAALDFYGTQTRCPHCE